ncbi:MAG: aspartate--tRNA(Asn) ligase [Anaerolinea sp.]|nr:aspartate--tRNA(Asn) ligase [Anaerolinea sp.]MCC6973230.1 aspartate--tRNA(Asn) ligase [Anaerolineae bacterium]CAG0973695.1 nondiscriminating aspartyl-tRNA synthetase [Anaerolineae bacterium]
MQRHRTFTAEIRDHVGERVTITGWLHRLRAMGGVNFVILRDRTGTAQVVATEAEITPLHGLHTETVLAITGRVVETPQAPGGIEMVEPQFEIISPVHEATPFAIYKDRLRASMPVFLDHAVFGHRALERRAVLRLLSGVMGGFRETLNQKHFTEIQSPKLVESATESGANVFAADYFGRTAYLAQSPQFYKQIMVGVFERVYEVGPVFRAEPHATSRHLNQYVSLDVEFGFIRDHFDVMEMLIEVIKGIIEHLKTHYAPELNLLKAELPLLPDKVPHLYFPEAQQMLHDQFGVNDALGEPDLAPEHERILGKWARDNHNSDFVFVTGYPMVKRPFYTHPNPADPRYSNSFDLLFRGLELVTGGQRLHQYQDYLDAAARFRYPLEPFRYYFEAFKFGMPPHGGFAIGLERFVTQLLGLDNVRLAALFPRDMHRLAP